MEIEMGSQVEPDHYYDNDYDSKGRFCSYWHQIDEIIKLDPNEALEIGIGNGFVSKYLKNKGLRVTTLDIDKRLNPDVLGSVLQLPFPNESFDMIACYEVLEHLPYKDFPKALSEIHRASSSHAVFSVPDSTRAYRLDVQIPKIGEVRKLIQLPRLRAPKHQFNGEHYWEIGKGKCNLRKVMGKIHEANFELKKTYRIFEMPWHRFFVVEKHQGW
jgi:ubiquinone/menaquinone biosynthesis C-methylase UbiE